MYLSAAGANAQSHRLDVISNNLANVNTTGFKPHMSMIQSRHAEAIEEGEAAGGMGTIDDIGGGVIIRPNETQFMQGPIRQTGNPTDMAISEPNSFFVVQRGDQQLLTRAGNFLFDSRGQLVTTHGDPVLSTGGAPITIDPSQPYQIGDDGVVTQAGNRQSVMLARPPAPGDLSRVGDNLYQSLTRIDTVPTQLRAIKSGAIEASAVEPTGTMMQLIEATRMYEANVRMIQNQDQVMGQLISRVLQG
ncbi:MAG: flagellar hook basal-body protein [Planctomycetales bacterium]|nr:flagellar hook basal-body protein [Planctomycetales bacterium]